eukprot:CAMPEP_0181349360 /NCGR_PEP_ID=MMETSP1106-20121128/684_1 /TAXON_ID=81844 /ORGANISM="Mantoniella antarctica, Strain SL-175" /LENGTH=47 /DNA_ID= /DNA_START= /DNA_END= /DNA_ORIENTATION=
MPTLMYPDPSTPASWIPCLLPGPKSSASIALMASNMVSKLSGVIPIV